MSDDGSGLDEGAAIVCNLCGFWIDSSDFRLKARVILAHVAHYHPDAMTLAELEQQFHEDEAGD